MVVFSMVIADCGLRTADLISAAADGWTECSTGGNKGNGALADMRGSVEAFSRVEVTVDAATDGATTTFDGATEAVVAIVVSTVFILFVFLFVPRAFCLFC